MKRRPNLLIVSDTKIQKIGKQYFGFNSVVLELDVFKKIFDKITWIGFDYSGEPKDQSLLEIVGDKVEMILLPRSGGKSFLSKLKIAFLMPYYFFRILKEVQTNDFIHLRGPSGPMFLALLISKFYKKKQWIVKYANNWSDHNAPFFWKMQKQFMIQHNWNTGTVNGQWADMAEHLLAFENPCINSSEFDDTFLSKFEQDSKNLLFVGRIEFEKGIRTFMDSLNKIDCSKIKVINIVGTGKNVQFVKDFLSSKGLDTEINYLGAQSKEKVVELMRDSHFLILPTTASEGFPKVVAEAWSAGCIPISSNISSIGQYVKHQQNGFIWEYQKNIDFSNILNEALNTPNERLKELVKNGFAESQKFTYENYEARLLKIVNQN